MSKTVTIVMYHFVRELKSSRFPAIKGLELADFVGQIEYIRKHYTPVRMEDIIGAARSGTDDLPGNAILLTFDDGYQDHFQNVFPVLEKYRIQGSFFPPARPLLEQRVLDVNKIHFVLAAVEDKSRLVRFLFSEIQERMAGDGLESPESYYRKLAVPTRYDGAD